MHAIFWYSYFAQYSLWKTCILLATDNQKAKHSLAKQSKEATQDGHSSLACRKCTEYNFHFVICDVLSTITSLQFKGVLGPISAKSQTDGVVFKWCVFVILLCFILVIAACSCRVTAQCPENSTQVVVSASYR